MINSWTQLSGIQLIVKQAKLGIASKLFRKSIGQILKVNK